MLKVSDIVREGKGILLQGDLEQVCGSFSIDTRTINNGEVYVAIIGEDLDGNDYVYDAIDKGASICIISKKLDIPKKEGLSIIYVEDTIICLKNLARYIISNFNGKIVGITGSVGKTSTKDMLYSVVKTKYKTLATNGSFNNDIGLPLTILRYTDEEVMILEMGMNGMGEIKELTSVASPDIAIITNIGTAHIGLLGSRENILKAKLEIKEGSKKDAKLIINNDNDMLHKYYLDNINDKSIITVGIDNDSLYKAEDVNIYSDYSTFVVNNDKFRVNVGTKVFVYNALIAYALGHILGISDDLIEEGIENFTLSKKRLDIKTNKKGVVIIDDTYNANFDSMKAGLEVLGKRSEQRKIAVLGDMRELGEYSIQLHRDLADEVIKNNIDILVCVGHEMKYLEDEMKKKNSDVKVYSFDKNTDTHEFLDNLLKKGDVVLFKSSKLTNLTEVVIYLMK